MKFLFFLSLLIYKERKLSHYKNKNIEEKYSNTWYHLLINYVSEPIGKIAGGFKDKAASLFNTNTLKQTVHGRGKKLSKSETQKQSEKK